MCICEITCCTHIYIIFCEFGHCNCLSCLIDYVLIVRYRWGNNLNLSDCIRTSLSDDSNGNIESCRIIWRRARISNWTSYCHLICACITVRSGIVWEHSRLLVEWYRWCRWCWSHCINYVCFSAGNTWSLYVLSKRLACRWRIHLVILIDCDCICLNRNCLSSITAIQDCKGKSGLSRLISLRRVWNRPSQCDCEWTCFSGCIIGHYSCGRIKRDKRSATII